MTEEKVVRYNGNKVTYYSCSSPKKLIEGLHYRVKRTFIEKYQTNYEIYGIEGYLDASWFEEVRNKTFMAVAHNKPVIEKEYKCTIIEIVNGKLHLLNWNLYEIENVCQIEENLFKVKAVCNSFIVQIG